MPRHHKKTRTRRRMRGGVLEYFDPRYYLGMGPYSAATAAPAQMAKAAQQPVVAAVGTPQKQADTVMPGTQASSPAADAGVLQGGGRHRRTRRRKTRRSRR